MGGICARTINENLPNYELLCQNLEEKLILPTINIKEIYEMPKITEFSQIYQFFINHKVSENEFVGSDSIFMQFFDGIENYENIKLRFIMKTLMICKGNITDKINSLYECLLFKKSENIQNLQEIISSCTIQICKIILKTTEKIDENIKIIANCKNEIIQKYIENLYDFLIFNNNPKVKLNVKILQENIDKKGGLKFFNSKYHRRKLLKYIQKQENTQLSLTKK